MSEPAEIEGRRFDGRKIRPGFRKLNAKKRALIANILADTGSTLKAAKIAGVSFQAIYQCKDTHEDFARQFHDAQKMYQVKLEEECDRRAAEGWDKPVIYEGKITNTYKEYSDNLLMFRLKSMAPEKYRDNFHITGKIEQSLDRETLDAIMQSPKARELAREVTATIIGKNQPLLLPPK